MDAKRSDFARLRTQLDAVQAAVREAGLDGWLFYDLHARNAVAAGMLGVGDLTRRYFVLVPSEGEPHALTHGIEGGPWSDWPWQRSEYVGWKPLREQLGGLVGGRRLAMETSALDAVPAMDLVPAGVLELVRDAGAREVVSSGDLVTRFWSRWSGAGLEQHRRAARVLAETARGAFGHVAERVRAGERVDEGGLKRWVLEQLAERGAGVDGDCIVARTENAADPHFSPQGAGAEIREGDILLLDLWGRESDGAVFADQTWMAYVGAEVPERYRDIFAVIREARDAGVALLRERAGGEAVPGADVDDAVRAVVRDAGYGDAFIHRTGHSIDRELHGMGPNIDNLETRETRRLISGVGFSIEPGIYLAGDVGMRTEIDVYMREDGPEVTTPEPQHEIAALLAD